MGNALSRRLDQIEKLERQSRPFRTDTRTWRQVLRNDPAAWGACLWASTPVRNAADNAVYRKHRG